MLAYRPDEFRAFMAYHDALMDKEGGLTRAEREMIVVATSAANQCQYCIIAHGAILRVRARNSLIADQIAANYRKADITPRQRAMLDFAVRGACADALLCGRDQKFHLVWGEVLPGSPLGIGKAQRRDFPIYNAWPSAFRHPFPLGFHRASIADIPIRMFGVTRSR
jgi:AhpD family alkylhydroperoxidase